MKTKLCILLFLLIPFLGFSQSQWFSVVGDDVPFLDPLLDYYPNAAAAYSLRLLKSDYAGWCIKVRRSSDDDTLSIGFVDGVLDTASLLTFTGAGDGFVSIWYDQSGNANNATQTTTTKQPKIVSGGVIELDNGLPALRFDGSDDGLSANQVSLVADATIVSVFKRDANAWSFIFGQGRSNSTLTVANQQFSLATNSSSLLKFESKRTGSDAVIGQTTYLNTQIVCLSSTVKGGNLTAKFNEVNETQSDGAGDISTYTTPLAIGRSYARNSFTLNGTIQECILYANDKTSDLAAIESNINTFYSIY